MLEARIATLNFCAVTDKTMHVQAVEPKISPGYSASSDGTALVRYHPLVITMLFLLPILTPSCFELYSRNIPKML